MCLKGEAAICDARLLSVFRQVRAHLWHEGPAGGLSGIRTHNLITLACLEVQALPLSYLLHYGDWMPLMKTLLQENTALSSLTQPPP